MNPASAHSPAPTPAPADAATTPAAPLGALARAFAALAAARRKTLIPYVTAGYPDVATTIEILRQVDPRQCAAVELGIPFSDPIADGPVIQMSFYRALAAGFRLEAFFGQLAAARATIRVPIIAMISYSIVHRRGPAEFLNLARVDGLIVPDLAFEEARDLAALGAARQCPLVLIAAPTTSPARRAQIAELSSPFIYYQSVAGITGERRGLPLDLEENVGALRAAAGISKPICVGFGISTPEDVRAVCRVSDGAIVGSALVRRMNEAVDRGETGVRIAADVTARIAELSAATNV